MPLVDELLGACPDEASRAAVARVLRLYRGQRVYIPGRESGQQQRRRIAAEALLDAGFSRREAAKALAERFGISRRTAYRALSALSHRWHN